MKTYSMELPGNEVHQVRNLVSFIHCLMHGEATVFTATPGCNVAHRFNYSVFAKLNKLLFLGNFLCTICLAPSHFDKTMLATYNDIHGLEQALPL